MRAAAILTIAFGAAASARAAPEDLLHAFDREPSVASLQRAAARLAELQPERVRSWLRRVRKAPLLPSVRARVSHGPYGFTASDYGYGAGWNGWRVDVEASWSLDKLVFSHDELALGRESQRLAARRETLLTEVAQLYFERRRLQVEALTTAPGSDDEQLERRLAIGEITAILDGLTDGALSRRSGP